MEIQILNSKLKNDYKLIELEESLKYQTYTHASHAMLWCKDHRQTPTTIYTLMQIRRDGLHGFPGGKVDEKVVDRNEVVATLRRELIEEINYNATDITIEDHVFTHIGTKKHIVLHFFAKELPLNEFELLERTHMSAKEFAVESLGLTRVPLRADGVEYFEPTRRFFTGYSSQNFAGNAKEQLLRAAINLNLFGKDDAIHILQMP